FFSSRRRHTISKRDWSSDVCSSDLLHPYTQALTSAIPDPNPLNKKERIILKGDVPSPQNPPSGCVFHTRCPVAMPECKEIVPQLKEVRPYRQVACLLYE